MSPSFADFYTCNHVLSASRSNNRHYLKIIGVDGLNGGGVKLGRVERLIEIKVSPEQVWAMLAWDRTPEWVGVGSETIGPRSVEYTSEVRTLEDKYKIGASARITGKLGEELDYEILESLKPKKLTTRSASGNVTLTGTFILKPTEVGTEVTYVVDYELPGGSLGKILDRLVLGKKAKKDIDLETMLKNLKRILEQQMGEQRTS